MSSALGPTIAGYLAWSAAMISRVSSTERVVWVRNASGVSGASASDATSATLSVDDTAQVIAALRSRYPDIVGPKAEDICYATSNRQAAVKRIAADCDLVLVIGAPNSSNSLRLVEVAERCGTAARLIQRASEIDPAWLEGAATVGVTAGASAPEDLVREVVDRLGEWREVEEHTLVSAVEKMIFKLPRQLTD